MLPLGQLNDPNHFTPNNITMNYPSTPEIATTVGELCIRIYQDASSITYPANNIVIVYSPRDSISEKLMEITLGITGQAAISLLAYASTSSSSRRGLHFVVAANAVGFIGTFAAMWFKSKKRVAVASVVGKIGAIAAACSMIVAMGMFLPANIAIWIIGFACLFSGLVVAFS